MKFFFFLARPSPRCKLYRILSVYRYLHFVVTNKQRTKQELLIVVFSCSIVLLLSLLVVCICSSQTNKKQNKNVHGCIFMQYCTLSLFSWSVFCSSQNKRKTKEQLLIFVFSCNILLLSLLVVCIL